MSLLFRFCDLEISLSSFNSLNLFLQFLCHLAWLSTSVGAIPLLRPKTPYSMALVETLSCQILKLLKLLFHMSLVDLYPNALSPKATAEPRLHYLDKRYTYPNPQIHWLWRLWLVYRHFCQTFLWHDAIAYHTQAKTIHLVKLILLLLYYIARFALSYTRWTNITTWLVQGVVFAEK